MSTRYINRPSFGPPAPPTEAMKNVLAVICSKNGSATIATAVLSVREQCEVYVFDDGSDDDLSGYAHGSGAKDVIRNPVSKGKPWCVWAWLAAGYADEYDAVVVLDDDTVLEPGFIKTMYEQLIPGIAIVVGKTKTNWQHAQRWNMWVGTRAYSYWRYQLMLRQGQSALNVMPCISGSNSMYRTEVLKQVCVENTPYIVDDTYWTLETHRNNLGRIKYVPEAVALIQDPTNFRDWYKQNLRWLWGSFQGVIGHKVGRKFTKFDVAYGALIVDWAWYVLATPILLILALMQDFVDPIRFVEFYLGGYGIWAVGGALALKRWRLIPMLPAIILVDWVYRFIFIHAFIKCIKQPTVASCVWESPKRYNEGD